MQSKDMAIGYAIGYNDGLGQGGSEYDDSKWMRPSDWPEMSDPEDNQVIMLITTWWNDSSDETFDIYAHNGGYTSGNFDGTTSVKIDWGDGTNDKIDLPINSESINVNHTFANGTILENGAIAFVVTITLPENAYLNFENLNCYPLEIFIGSNVKFHKDIIKNEYLLEHIKLFGWQPNEKDNFYTSNGILSGNYNLQCVDTTIPLTYIPKSAFSNCFNLKEIDLSQCTSIEESGLSTTALTTVTSSKLIRLASMALGYCRQLKYVNTPALIGVQSGAFAQCFNIENITHSEDWVYESGSFRQLFKWFDNPEKPRIKY